MWLPFFFFLERESLRSVVLPSAMEIEGRGLVSRSLLRVKWFIDFVRRKQRLGWEIWVERISRVLWEGVVDSFYRNWQLGYKGGTRPFVCSLGAGVTDSLCCSGLFFLLLNRDYRMCDIERGVEDSSWFRE